MKKFVKNTAYALLLVLPTFSHALVNQVKTLVHEDSGNTLLLLSDTHLDKKGGKATAAQQEAILDKAKTHNALVIAEDGYSFPISTFKKLGLSSEKTSELDIFLTGAREIFAENNGIPSEYVIKFASTNIDTPINPQKFTKNTWHNAYIYSPLNTLVEQSKAMGLAAHSFDFQLVRQASELGYNLTIKDIVDTEQALIDTILADTSTPIFKPYYQEYIDEYYANPGVKKLIALTKKSPSLNYQEAKDQIGAHALECHEEWLMNANLLYTCSKHLKGHKTAIVYAGHAHTDTILPALLDAGYIDRETYGERAWFGDNDQCILPIIDLKNAF